MRYLPLAALASTATFVCSLVLLAQPPTAAPASTSKATHGKTEHLVPMRDGTRLHTAVYAPRRCPPGGAPIVLQRTPYGSAPYGGDAYPASVGPASLANDPGLIVAYQDVRGRYLSEGVWEEVRPIRPSTRGTEADESTDAYDTIEWLVRHVPCNNGRVGMWGISYPGFYALAALVNAHPALKAVSPQGPVTDYYLGDDSFHNGAFLLAHNFSFYVDFPPRGPQPRPPQATKEFDYGTRDGYRFYLAAGSLAEMTRTYGLSGNPYWRQNLEHTTYDAFWKARSVWRHFRDVTPAVLVVGGWFDAEDLSGPLRAFRTLRAQSPGTTSHLAMGPWTHGGWARGDGAQVAQVRFGEDTSRHYREQLERPFFERHLKGRGGPGIPAVSVYETGSNRWRTFDTWPVSAERVPYYLAADGALARTPPAAGVGVDTYVSDPANPVPGVAGEALGMPRDYMASDQRFAAQRPDVLVYKSPVLLEDVTVLGPIGVRLHVATSGTDADFVVKVLDEYGAAHPQAGMQQLVRGEPFRGKFRRSFETPVAFTPNQPDELRFDLPDVAHTFARGHRIVVHVQSSWFPIFDRNPQTFTDIPQARPEQFVKATQRVYRNAARPSRIVLPVAQR